MVSTLVRIPGYCLTEELYNGSRTLVYRGYREADSLPIVIKLLKNPYPSFSELLSFRNQYTIAKNLNSPLIVQTYSLETYQNGYALVMEDFGGVSLKEWKLTGNLQSLQEFLEIALALCDTLNLLYHERIIHKDIKPSNILINPQTKQIKLIDFSIASLLPRETQTLVNPNVLEGTLAYISPEQTGRMNRGIDYRTDFYSLGVTFYELLTGELPFACNEPMELIHSHIAKIAPLVHEINLEISSVLSKIVSKLMAKNAEDRYQNALGLKFDLEKCLHQLQVSGKIESFEIAQHDVCDRFIIPDKLYGREAEAATLLQAFERVSLGATEMMLVAGFSGIGKTAVVNEVHKPIVRQRGYFIKGKYDQFQRNIPFSAFVQAFRNLMSQLLSETDIQLTQWKQKILEAVGENGQVLIEVIPELEQIIGKQPPAAELSGSAAQNRFNLLFGKFIAVFATQQHPLVMFLDDLQWADSASLNLIQVLMSQSEVGYLFIIGAYRDNEVFAAHPLMLVLNDIQKTQAIVNTLTLAPLSQADVNHLIADTLSCDRDRALPLTELVYQKTKGNPFFTTQFLKALYDDNLITFDWQAGSWQCDVTQVRSLSLTDDVVEFMALQIQKLPVSTQNTLKLAACIGNQFDLDTLAIVSEQTQEEAATQLWKALQEGLILPISETYKFFQSASLVAGHSSLLEEQRIVSYKFLHDRVQQSAYSLIPDDQKQTTHYKIGQLLLQRISSSAREERIFEIVNQLNYGKFLIAQQPERDDLAQLNLLAARKAKTATAYAAALEYTTVGIELLSSDCWSEHYLLTLQLHETAAEAAYLAGNFSQMTKAFETVMQRCQTVLDRIQVIQVRIQGFATQNQHLEAIELALETLEQLGVSLPHHPTFEEIQQEFGRIAAAISQRSFDDLLHLPAMRDPYKLAASQILSYMGSITIIAKPELLPIAFLRQVKLSLDYGNSPFSAHGYTGYGILVNSFLKDGKRCYELSQLALQLIERSATNAINTKVFQGTGGYCIHHYRHVSETLPYFDRAYASGLENGDLEFLGYAAMTKCQYLYFLGRELTELDSAIAAYNESLAKLNQKAALSWNQVLQQAVLNLIVPGPSPFSLTGDFLQEDEFIKQHIAANDRLGLHYFYSHKLILCTLLGDYEQGLENANQAALYLDGALGFLNVPIFHFYDSLVRLQNWSNVSDKQRTDFLAAIDANQEKLRLWADTAPMNYQHKWELVEAEKHRVLKQYLTAFELYDRAITLASKHEYFNEAAIANELAARFYFEWDKQRIAQEYLIEAYYGYARWGAKAKVADLEKRYPQLLAPILQQPRSPFSTNETIFALGSVTSTSSATSSSSVCDSLDLKAILKASHTLSGEIELSKLLSSLLKIVIKNAGADRCVLMLMRDNRLLIKGSIAGESNPVVLQRIPIEDSQDIPHKLIYKVLHERQTAVLINASADPTLANDPYIIRQQSKSILCSPILHQGKLLGILYLENNLVTGAFTSDRVELLNLLCAQAAISLENARLYERSLEYAQQLERSLSELSAAQSSLRASQQRLQLLVQQTPLAVIEWDTNFQITDWNPAAERIFGYTKQEALGCETKLIIPQSIQAEIHQVSIDTILQQGGNFNINENVTKGGKTIICAWYNSPLVSADGELIGIASLADDITEQQAALRERKIAEAQLQQKAQELETALQNLQQAQLQMIQSEKMSALGNLVAGVAHEMNNPLGFISASLKLAKPTFADIVNHLKLYQETLLDKSEEIEDHESEIDLEYSLSDLPKMLDSMTMACDRLKNISTSLRTFSRADRDYKVPFNIHEGIDSTILILKHRLKANDQRPAIEVVTNYGNLPQVECFPGQLNQVFMNILANAIDALDESNVERSFEDIQANPNRITITTSVENTYVKIAIADNGKGMSESVKSKIFDHLFTTKAVGKGTGLGLAIAKSIVESTHSGKLSCNSVLGQGTEFLIEIPA